MYSTSPSSSISTKYLLLPPLAKRALIPFLRMISPKKTPIESAVPPAPAWKEKPSRIKPASSQNFAVNSAIRSLSGLLVIFVVPEIIFSGIPI